VTDAPPLLEAVDVQKLFPLTRSLGAVVTRKAVRSVHAVDGVSISVGPGETLGLIGESGSGKTTLGWLISRIHEPSGGQIRFEGKDVTHLAGEELRLWRRNVQVVFQDPVGSLDPRLRVWQIVGEPIRAQAEMNRWSARRERKRVRARVRAALASARRENRARRRRRPPEPPVAVPAPPPFPPIPRRLTVAAVRKQVVAMLPSVGLPADCLDQYPHEFSGGGRQRISLARALIVQPNLIVLDEPTSALDVAVQAQILNRLVELQRERGIAYLLITHNVAAVRFAADRVAVMYLGQVVEYGKVREVLERPVHPYTKALLAAVPQPDPGRRKKRYRIEGDIPSLIDPKPGCRFAPRCPFVQDACRTADPPLVPHPGVGGRVVACIRAEEVADIPPESFLVAADAPTAPPGTVASTVPG
jgi:oligopeptide transport system ATP-binding protein